MSNPVPPNPTATFPDAFDKSRYKLTVSDFVFLDINGHSAWNCARKDVPLGIPEPLFSYFVSDLFFALDMQGIHDADVRIQGSSTTFYSNESKTLPDTRMKRLALFMDLNDRLPSQREGDEIERRYDSVWGAYHPEQRPFDSLFKLGISNEPSDIDVQIASSDAFALARKIAAHRGIAADEIAFDDPHYNFLTPKIAEQDFLQLLKWREMWARDLGRGVAYKIFDAGGPPKKRKGLSSHFRETDWILRPPTVTGQ